jgi:hypothetical protein
MSDMTIVQPTNEHINRKRNRTTEVNETASQPASKSIEWHAIQGRNVAIGRQGNKFLLLIDMDAESEVATQRGTKYIAKIDDRTELTIDGEKYHVGFWMKAVETRAAANKLSL